MRRPVKKAGSVTVFMALLLGLVTVLVAVCMLSVRTSCARTQILCGADIGLYSLFGQYDRRLFSEYEILGIDSGSGKQDSVPSAVYDVFCRYLEPVLQQNSQGLTLLSGGFSGLTYLTDQDGGIFAAQAVRSTRTAPFSSVFRSSYCSAVSPSVIFGTKAGKQALLIIRQRAEEELSDGEEEDISDGTAIMMAEQFLSQGIAVCIPPSAPGRTGGDTAGAPLLSERERHGSFPVLASLQAETSPDSGNRLIQYEADKLGCVTDPAAGQLRLQLEYVLYGHRTDRENLYEEASDLLTWRLYRNLQSSGSSRTGQSDMALQALGNACRETFRMLQGESVDGLTCRTYLQARLGGTDRRTLVRRGMDMVESALRGEGRPLFSLDCCVTACEVTFSVRSAGLVTFRVTRAFGYDIR